MRWLAVVALAAALFAACSGVLTAPGNDFPCDFSKPPGERDAVCSPGDVCGVQNRCQRFRYEGPQFEGKPTFPFFTDAGARLHPGAISGPVDFVVRAQGSEQIFVHTRQSPTYFRIWRGTVVPVVFPAGGMNLPPASLDDVVLFPRPAAAPQVYGRVTPSNEVYAEGNVGNRLRVSGMLLRASRLRSVDPESDRVMGVITDPPDRAGILRSQAVGDVFEAFLNSGTHIDLAPGPTVQNQGLRQRTALGLSSDGFRQRFADGGITVVLEQSMPQNSLLASDVASSTYAVLSARPMMLPLLSTFSLVRTGSNFALSSPWSDCGVCPAPLAFTPGTDGLGPFVEVLCQGEDGLRRVRGALASGVECLSEAVTPPFDLQQLATRARTSGGATHTFAVQDSAAGAGFLAGGLRGQVWSGPTISTALPLFLDRVPQDVIPVATSDGGIELFALSQAGLSRATPEHGFVSIAPELTSRVVGLVGEGQGWLIGEGGHLVVVEDPTGPVTRLRFGPRLVDGRREAVSRVLRGEAVATFDGGLVSMVVAADDSLYFVPAPAETNRAPGLLGDVAPVLTPEPSTLIRSLALERTALGTDGVTRMRGYLVTARNVYEFKLGGAPLRWTATPLPLSGAEPLEVWFDNPRGGLARAGYRDGTIFSIPGGFQLTEPLPANDAGIPAAVADYENLGGWPVALTNAGLFVARYDALPDGKLDTRFPDAGLGRLMTWREVTLPDGSRPWMPEQGRRAEARPGKLLVVADPQTGSNTAYRRLFHLLLFLPDQVLEVGQHERTNISTRVE
jgi:hypothetical protein